MNNKGKFLFVVLLILLIGSMTVLAKQVDKNKFDKYKPVKPIVPINKNQKFTGTINFTDLNGVDKIMTIEKGLIVDVSDVIYKVPDFPVDGLVSYYKLDGDDNAIDSKEHYDIIENGAIPNQTGLIGGARGHYSVNDYFQINNHKSLDETNSFTFSIWFYPNTAYDGSRFFTIDDGINGKFWGNLRYETGNIIQAWLGKAGSSASVHIDSSTVLLGDWHHIVFTYDNESKQAKLFLDNILQGTDIYSNGDATVSNTICLGSSYGGYSPLNAGILDEFGYWNRTLDDIEISNLYNNGIGLTYPL